MHEAAPIRTICSPALILAQAGAGRYPTRTLSRWAELFTGWSQESLRIFCCLDNDEVGHAVHDVDRDRLHGFRRLTLLCGRTATAF
jgi:hypothetical protein